MAVGQANASRKRGNTVWSDIARLSRSAWFVAILTIAAVLASLELLPEPTGSVRLRQPMTVEGASWLDLATAHDRNEAWVESSLPTSPSVRLERPSSESTSFLLVVTAADHTEAEAALAEVIDGLGHVQPAWSQPLDTREALVTTQLDDARSALDASAGRIADMRSEREAALSVGDQLRADALAADQWVEEDERRRLNAVVGDLERDLDAIALDRADLPRAVPVGSPFVEDETPALSSESRAAAIGFAVAIVSAAAAMAFDRRRGRVRDIGALARVFPDRRTAVLNSEAIASGGVPELAAVAHQVAQEGLATLTVVDATRQGAAPAVSSLQQELALAGLGSRVLAGAGLLERSHTIGLGPDELALIVVPAADPLVAERVVAHSAQAIVVIDDHARSASARRMVDRLEALGAPVLLVLLAEPAPDRPRRAVVTRSAVGPTLR
ncbi:MAG: hypothetical protein R2733_00250 [Acidimicrobiales bacterium]